MPAKKRATQRPRTKSQPVRKAAGVRTPKRAARPARTTRDSLSSPADANRSGVYTVRIRYRSDQGLEELNVPVDDRNFYPSVQRWRYVVANRRRITRSTSDDLSQDLQSLIQDAANVSKDEILLRIRKMAAAKLVEVSIPYHSEDIGWSARLFPWESALWLLTLPYRSESGEFAVVRHLDSEKQHSYERTPTKALVVDSGPGQLGSMYDFAREVVMVEGALKGVETRRLRDPDREQLKSAIASDSPSIVHLVPGIRAE